MGLKGEKACDRFGRPVDGQKPGAGTASLAGLKVTDNFDPAKKVRDAYAGKGGKDLLGVTAKMPEEALSIGINDELQRLLYLTLTVGIDYQRDALSLWRHARERFDDPKTRWLFKPSEVANRTVDDVLSALKTGNPRAALRYPRHDARWWHRNASTLATEFEGDPRVLFKRADWDVLNILREVKRRNRFQGLKGPKIFPLWLRILNRVLGYEFKGYEALPIPVDVHIARATFTTGLVRGRYDGPFDSNLIDFIRQAWTEACKRAGEAHMTFDEPLWQLSRLGCTRRNERSGADCPVRSRCPIGETCPKSTIELSMSGVSIAT